MSVAKLQFFFQILMRCMGHTFYRFIYEAKIVYFLDILPYLWLNVLGCLLVMSIALFLQTTTQPKNAS